MKAEQLIKEATATYKLLVVSGEAPMRLDISAFDRLPMAQSLLAWLGFNSVLADPTTTIKELIRYANETDFDAVAEVEAAVELPRMLQEPEQVMQDIVNVLESVDYPKSLSFIFGVFHAFPLQFGIGRVFYTPDDAELLSILDSIKDRVASPVIEALGKSTGRNYLWYFARSLEKEPASEHPAAMWSGILGGYGEQEFLGLNPSSAQKRKMELMFGTALVISGFDSDLMLEKIQRQLVEGETVEDAAKVGFYFTKSLLNYNDKED